MMVDCSLTAFYGGTFDPIHYGHLRSVEALSQLIQLKQIFFLPNNIPPHRPQPVASPQQRLIMTRLAVDEMSNELFSVDDREFKRPTPSWMIDTFKDVRNEYGQNIPLGFIIGQDSLVSLFQWYCGPALLNFCHLLVCSRPGYIYRASSENLWFNNRFTQNIQKIYKKPSGFIYCANTPLLEISASNIRIRYKEGRNCDGLLPDVVQRYIYKQGLYR